jgi:hypothetical protein
MSVASIAQDSAIRLDNRTPTLREIEVAADAGGVFRPRGRE